MAFDLQGHRGARGLAPENTLAAFARALEIGVTTLETDLAVTRDGVQSGPGGMDYEHDMPPYVQEMADWLDDDNKPHPLRFERAFHGLEIMSALYRSAIQGGQIALPLTAGMDELDGLRGRVPDRKVLMTLTDSAKEYKE